MVWSKDPEEHRAVTASPALRSSQLRSSRKEDGGDGEIFSVFFQKVTRSSRLGFIAHCVAKTTLLIHAWIKKVLG